MIELANERISPIDVSDELTVWWTISLMTYAIIVIVGGG